MVGDHLPDKAECPVQALLVGHAAKEAPEFEIEAQRRILVNLDPASLVGSGEFDALGLPTAHEPTTLFVSFLTVTFQSVVGLVSYCDSSVILTMRSDFETENAAVL